MVSFPTVGGVISKSLGRSLAVCSEPLRHCFLPDIRSIAVVFSFEHGGVAWLLYLGLSHFTNNVAYAFQLAGYTAAISPFRWLILLRPASCGISLRRRLRGDCRYFVRRHDDDDPAGSSDATALLTALKNMHARLLNMPVYSGSLKQPMPFVQHMRGDWTDTDHEFAPYPGFLEPHRFRQQNARLNALLHQQLRMPVSSPACDVCCSTGPHRHVPTRNSRTAADGARQFANRCLPVARIIAPLRPTNVADYRHVPSGSDYVIFAAFICKVVRN